MSRDHYTLFKVSRDASADEIRRAYHKLALECHPDRNLGDVASATERFKKISEAYAILSDEVKRAAYDRSKASLNADQSDADPRRASSRSSAHPRRTDSKYRPSPPDSPSSGYTTDRSPPRRSTGTKPPPPSSQSSPRDSASAGYTTDRSPPRRSSGTKRPADHDSFRRRPGTRFTGDDSDLDWVRPLKVTLEEVYTGTTKRVLVKSMRRTGRTMSDFLRVDVQPGWRSGTTLRVPGAGDEKKGSGAQDLVFVLEEMKHSVFQTGGDDLFTTVRVADWDTAQREVVYVQHLDGRMLRLHRPKGHKTGRMMSRLAGEGMPSSTQKGKKGDLLVCWDIGEKDDWSFLERDVDEEVFTLRATLEELYTGTTKMVQWTRTLLSGKKEDMLTEMNVMKGGRNGWRTKLLGAGDERHNGQAQDIVFVVKEEPHPVFRRVEDDLHMTYKVNLAGPDHPPCKVRLLNGDVLHLEIPQGTSRPRHTRIRGGGMPSGSSGRHGDLIVNWEITGKARRTRST